MAKPKMKTSKTWYACCEHCTHPKYDKPIHGVPCVEYVQRDGNRVKCQEDLR